MPFPIRALFRRYCDHHLWIKGPGFALFDADGQPAGYVDMVHHGVTTVQVDGWTTCSAVSLSKPGAYSWSEPNIERSDVAMQLGLEKARVGFQLQANVEDGSGVVAIRHGQVLITTPVPSLTSLKMRMAKARLGIRFIWDCFVGAPSLLRHLMMPNAQSRQRAKHALRMVEPGHEHRLQLPTPDVESSIQTPNKVTIIVPVYNAFEDLKECLSRVEKNTDVPWRMVLVEDCSSDKRVRAWLLRWAGRRCAIGHDVQLLLNDQNLGFVGSVNRAFEAAQKHSDHVILLNSDALVPPNWASRLVHPICADPKVASVTPMSNNAEILNAPIACRAHELPAFSGDKIDRSVAQRIGVTSFKPIPTGVGFCMAMNAEFLRQVPSFDPAFGKGYGEEVDWCQKARSHGGIHVAQVGIFVEHRGGASFGSEAKNRSIRRNNAIVSSRYPKFDQEVQQFIANDPLRTVRMIHAIATSCATQSQVPVYIAHSMGGGAEFYLAEQIAKITARGEAALILRVGGPELWRVEHHSPLGILLGSLSRDEEIVRLLHGFRNLEIVYSCGVGHPQPTAIPKLLADLAGISSRKLIMLVHDYFCISERYTLLNDCGQFDTQVIFHPESDAWRHHWRIAIAAADEIRCFSQSSDSLVQIAYPTFRHKIVVTPHKIETPREQLSAKPSGPIGVLGDIGAQKGAALVSRLTRASKSETSRRIVVIGRLDPAFACGSQGEQTGAYKRNQIANIANRKGLSCWLIPSIWPETFSYTTHEALATGLPVFVFDLGGQADAARAAPNGHVMPLTWADDPQRVSNFINGVLHDAARSGRVDQRAQRRGRRGFAA